MTTVPLDSDLPTAAPDARRGHRAVARPRRAGRWTARQVVGAIAMGALGVLATFPEWADIFLHATKDMEYSHIWLVPVVAACMVWVRRLRFRHCRPTGQTVGVAIAAAGWAISAVGFYNGVQSFRHGGAVLVVLGCVLCVLGKHALFRFFPAVAVLVFLVPVPGRIRQEIAIPLQNWTAALSQAVLETCGMPVERSGNVLSVNGTDVGIVEACNGLRMVWPLILMSYAFSFGLPLRNWVRLLLLLASPLAAIFCNVVRILPTVWLYGYQSRGLADAFHEYSGWLMLGVSFLLLMGIIRLLRWAAIPVMRYTLAA